MRTICSSGRLSWGGGCLLWGGECLLLGGGGGIPACTEADTPLCGQAHACKNITFATSLRMVKMEILDYSSYRNNRAWINRVQPVVDLHFD